MEKFRIERDSIGEKQVPVDAYYGVQSLRAKENFKISGKKVHPEFISSMAEVKKAAAIANKNSGALSADRADAIVKACDDILNGKYLDSFIVDAIQGGAGTSLNMNANEVIANIAIEYLGGVKGDYKIVHPNDHVNCAQSTNDAYPSAGKIAVIKLLKRLLLRLKILAWRLKIKQTSLTTLLRWVELKCKTLFPSVLVKRLERIPRLLKGIL